MGGVFALITRVMHQTLSKNVWKQSFRAVWAWLFVSCVPLTSLAFPTWQVCVRDQLEASNTITFPLFTDTHNWPEIENTHTHRVYQLFLNTLSLHLACSEYYFYRFLCLLLQWLLRSFLPVKGNTSCQCYFAARLHPTNPTVRFLPTDSALLKNAPAHGEEKKK